MIEKQFLKYIKRLLFYCFILFYFNYSFGNVSKSTKFLSHIDSHESIFLNKLIDGAYENLNLNIELDSSLGNSNIYDLLDEVKQSNPTQFTRFNTESHRLRIPIQTQTILEHFIINKHNPKYVILIDDLFAFVKESQQHDKEKDTKKMNKALARNYGKDYDQLPESEKLKAYRSRDILNLNGKIIEHEDFLKNGYAKLSQNHKYELTQKGKRFKEIIIYADLYDTSIFRGKELKHNRKVSEFIEYLIKKGETFEGIEDMNRFLELARDLESDMQLQNKLYSRSKYFSPENYILNRKPGLHFSKIQKIQRKILVSNLEDALLKNYSLNGSALFLSRVAHWALPMVMISTVANQTLHQQKSSYDSFVFIASTGLDYYLGYNLLNPRHLSLLGFLYPSTLDSDMVEKYKDEVEYEKFLNLSLSKQQKIIDMNKNSDDFNDLIFRARPDIKNLTCNDNLIEFEDQSKNYPSFNFKILYSNNNLLFHELTAIKTSFAQSAIHSDLEKNLTCFEFIEAGELKQFCVFDFNKSKIKEIPNQYASLISIDLLEKHFKTVTWLKSDQRINQLINYCGVN